MSPEEDALRRRSGTAAVRTSPRTLLLSGRTHRAPGRRRPERDERERQGLSPQRGKSQDSLLCRRK